MHHIRTLDVSCRALSSNAATAESILQAPGANCDQVAHLLSPIHAGPALLAGFTAVILPLPPLHL